MRVCSSTSSRARAGSPTSVPASVPRTGIACAGRSYVWPGIAARPAGRGRPAAPVGWLEVDERWHYDQHDGAQVLRRLICLCSSCHLVTHFGYADVTDRIEQAFAHLRQITSMDDVQARAHVRTAESLWIERSARIWALDLGMLTGAGITVRRPERAHERPILVEEALRREAGRVQARRPSSVTERDMA